MGLFGVVFGVSIVLQRNTYTYHSSRFHHWPPDRRCLLRPCFMAMVFLHQSTVSLTRLWLDLKLMVQVRWYRPCLFMLVPTHHPSPRSGQDLQRLQLGHASRTRQM